MSIGGSLDISIDTSSGTARIASSRPMTFCRAFEGRAPSEVASLIPLAFSVCGTAQAVTCVTACERALAITPSPAAACCRAILVLTETAREHLLRVLIDWPRLLGNMPDLSTSRRVLELTQRFHTRINCNGSAFAIGASSGATSAAPSGASLPLDAGACTAFVTELEKLIEDSVFGEPPAIWLERHGPADLSRWFASGSNPAQSLLRHVHATDAALAGAIPLTPLPEIPNQGLTSVLLDEGGMKFAAAPHWNGAPQETTVLSRMAAHPTVVALKSTAGYGLICRLVARLVELAHLPARIRSLLSLGSEVRPEGPHGTGRATAQVEAARGRLAHAVEIESGRVLRYRILAPTEWNFHPEGPVARALLALASRGRAETLRLADLVISAFDPCVDYRVTVH